MSSLSKNIHAAVQEWLKHPADTTEFEIRVSSRKVGGSAFTNFDVSDVNTQLIQQRLHDYFGKPHMIGGRQSKFTVEHSTGFVDTIAKDDSIITRTEWRNESGTIPKSETKTRLHREDNHGYGIRFDVSSEIPIPGNDPRNAIASAALHSTARTSVRYRKRVSFIHPANEYKVDITYNQTLIPKETHPDSSYIVVGPGMSRIFIEGYVADLLKRGQPPKTPDRIKIKDKYLVMTNLYDFKKFTEDVIIELEFLPELRTSAANNIEEIGRKVYGVIITLLNIIQDSFLPLKVGEDTYIIDTVNRMCPPSGKKQALRPQQPRNMKAKAIHNIMKNPYAFTIKSDGQERFLISYVEGDKGGTYLYSRKGTIQKLSNSPLVGEYYPVILQGELINIHHPSGRKTLDFHVFDAIYINGDIRQDNLRDRMAALHETIDMYGTDASLPVRIFLKPYFDTGNVCNDIKAVLAYRDDVRHTINRLNVLRKEQLEKETKLMGKYEERKALEAIEYPFGMAPDDGIVMTYAGEYDKFKFPPFKLKPAEDNTIDFQIVYNEKRSTAQMQVYDLYITALDKDKQQIRQQFRGSKEHPADAIIMTSHLIKYRNMGIYEVKYNPSTKVFTVVRQRLDKNTPNRLPTVLSIWEDIHSPFSFQDLVLHACSREGAEDIIGTTRLATNAMMKSLDTVKSMGIIGLYNGSILVNMREKPDTFIYGIPMYSDNISRIRSSVESFEVRDRFIYLNPTAIPNLPSTIPRDIQTYRQSAGETSTASHMIDAVMANMSLYPFFASSKDFSALINLVNNILTPGGKFTAVILNGDVLMKGFFADRNNKLFRSSTGSFSIERRFEFDSRLPESVIAESVANNRPLTDEDYKQEIVEIPKSKFGLQIRIQLGKREAFYEHMTFGSVLHEALASLNYERISLTSFLHILPKDQVDILSADDRRFLDLHAVVTFQKPGPFTPQSFNPSSTAFKLSEVKIPDPPKKLKKKQKVSDPPKKMPKKTTRLDPSDITKLHPPAASSAGDKEMDLAGILAILDAMKDGSDKSSGASLEQWSEPIPKLPTKIPKGKKQIKQKEAHCSAMLKSGVKRVISGKLPFSIPPDSQLIRIGVSGIGSCFYHSLLYAIDPVYQSTPISKRDELVRNYRKQLASSLTRLEFISLAGGLFVMPVLHRLAKKHNLYTAELRALPPTLLEVTLRSALGDVIVDKTIDKGLASLRKTLSTDTEWFDANVLPFVFDRAGINVVILNSDLRPRILGKSVCQDLYRMGRPTALILHIDDVHFEAIALKFADGSEQMQFPYSMAMIQQIYNMSCPGAFK